MSPNGRQRSISSSVTRTANFRTRPCGSICASGTPGSTWKYDVAWANQFLIRHLLGVFPAAKFIVLIRDCYTWLQSIMGHLAVRDVPDDVVAFLRWWFKADRFPHAAGDRVDANATCLRAVNRN